LYKRGDKATQDDFAKLFSALETVKMDRSSVPFSQHMEAIGATLSVFAVHLVPQDAAEYLATNQDSSQYYLNRIKKDAKERYLLRSLIKRLIAPTKIIWNGLIR
jgi:hypothetical protein